MKDNLMKPIVGDVYRVFNGAFSDAVVTNINENGTIDLARPYVYVSSANTACPVPLVGYETIKSVSPTNYKLWKLVAAGRTI